MARSANALGANSFENFLQSQQSAIGERLASLFPKNAQGVWQAAGYSLLLPSKRLRPIFCLETARAFSGAEDLAWPSALALELVHTYSLIHDDLPAMDDDDLRRGVPTNHIKYGEARAILAGDGLLTKAFEVLTTHADARLVKDSVRELSHAAGMDGMVLGQDLDMDPDPNMNLEKLIRLHEMKTGALISSALVLGALAGGATSIQVEKIRRIGFLIGLAFQIHDDVLDCEGGEELGKPVGSDEKNEKWTYVKLLGLDGAKKEANKWTGEALKELESFQFPHENRLQDLFFYVISRRK